MEAIFSEDARTRRANIYGELDRIDDSIKSIEHTVKRHPEASYMLDSVPEIETRRRELLAELSALEIESAPAPTVEETRSVPETESHLERLSIRLRDAQTQQEQLVTQLPTLEAAYRASVIGGSDDEAKLFDELSEARRLQAELNERSSILRAEIPKAEAALEHAKTAQAQREREHWQGVASKLPPGIERWCALIRANARPGVYVGWPDAWGSKPVPSQRLECMQRLTKRFPFRDDGA